MGICSAVDCTAALQSPSCLARSITGETSAWRRTLFLTPMNAPGQAQSLDQVELIALPVSRQIVIVRTKKHGLHAQDQRAPENGGPYI